MRIGPVKYTKTFALVLSLLLAHPSTSTPATATDWPQWHGPSRSGHASADAPAPTTLPKELKPAWKIPVGGGHSAPIPGTTRTAVVVREQE